MIKQFIFTIFATLFFTQAGIAQSTGTFTDSREGQAKVDKLDKLMRAYFRLAKVSLSIRMMELHWYSIPKTRTQ